MNDLSHLNKIRTLNDIKLEKARLRYELMVAESQIYDSMRSVESMASFPSLYSRIMYGFEIGQKIVEKVISIIHYFRSGKKKKKKKHKN